MSGKSSEEIDANYELYNNYVSAINDADLKNTENFDKHILTLSSASLAVSVTYLAKAENQQYLSLLFFSWFFLLVTVLLTTFTYFIRSLALERQCEWANEYYIEDKEGLEADLKKNKYVRWIKRTNVVVAIFFLSGIVLSVVFMGVNLNGSKQSEKKEVIQKNDQEVYLQKKGDQESGGQKTFQRSSETAGKTAEEVIEMSGSQDKKTKVIREDSGVPMPPVKPPSPANPSSTNSGSGSTSSEPKSKK